MRHRVAGRHLSRTSSHRLALRRNLVSSLFEHETISTTVEKAKEVKSFAEKLITLGKKGDLAARRRAISLLNNRAIYKEENGEMVKSGTVIGKLFSEIAPRYLDREGGYTRIIHLSKRRLGDNGKLVLLQLLGENEKCEPKPKKKKAAEPKKEAAVEAAEAQEQPVQETEQAPAVEEANEPVESTEVQGETAEESKKE